MTALWGGRAEKTETSVKLDLDYRKKPGSTGDIHWYELLVSVKNVSRRRLDDWEVEFEFPTVLLCGTVQQMRVPDRSDEETTFFLADGRKLGIQLRPGEERVVRIGYRVTHDIFYQQHNLLQQGIVKARALVDGVIAAETERSMGALQKF